MDRNRDDKTPEGSDLTSRSVRAVRQFRQPLVAYLLSGLEHDDKWVKILAAEMLGMAGDASIAGQLKPLLADYDQDLRTAGERSLLQITSHGPGLTTNHADYCGDCMIRLLASEALLQLKDRK